MKFWKFPLAAVLVVSPSVHAVTISLSAGSDNFNGLLLEGANNPNVGVILFHGRRSSPNRDVVRQLRHSLNTNGYTTLSIDNPVPDDGDVSKSNYRANEGLIENKVYSYFNAAVDSLVASNSNLDTIVIGGFSFGADFAVSIAAALEQNFITMNSNVTLGGVFGVGTWTGIGGTVPTTSDDINVYDTINNLGLISSTPILDLFGDQDAKSVGTAAARLNSFAGGSLDYTQVTAGCPNFNSASYFANDGGSAVAYTEINCHQLDNAYLTAEDALNKTNAAVILRGSESAPLESTVNNWIVETAPLTAVPVPAAIWLFGSGLIGLAGVARRKKA